MDFEKLKTACLKTEAEMKKQFPGKPYFTEVIYWNDGDFQILCCYTDGNIRHTFDYGNNEGSPTLEYKLVPVIKELKPIRHGIVKEIKLRGKNEQTGN